MATVIAAGRGRVWRALTVPEELQRWDERLLSPIDSTEGYPREGSTVRWRYRLGSVRVVRSEQPLEVVPGQRLRAQLGFGSLRIDATWTLSDENEGDQTRLGLRLVTPNSVPVLGGLFDRFSVRELAAELADAQLRQIQKWCEGPT